MFHTPSRFLRVHLVPAGAMQKTFEDLRAFQRALDLMVDVYEATKSYPRTELYGLTSQMRRAACSVVSCIAEGQGRLTYGEWRQSLSEARGSLYEVQAQAIASQRLGFLGEVATEYLKKQARLAGRELAGLITWVRRREDEAKSRSRRTPQTTSNKQPATKRSD